jgi:hypothetical protein
MLYLEFLFIEGCRFKQEQQRQYKSLELPHQRFSLRAIDFFSTSACPSVIWRPSAFVNSSWNKRATKVSLRLY